MSKEQKNLHRKKRRAHRTRARITGTAERPRLSVNRTVARISAQLIDDTTSTTLASANDNGLTGTKSEKAAQVGTMIAEAAKSQGVTTVVFDRGSSLYHGRVKALAESAREAGLEF